MNDSVRPSDIVDLKDAVKTLHQRIDTQDLKATAIAEKIDEKQDLIRGDIQGIVGPLEAMNNQVATNVRDIARVEADAKREAGRIERAAAKGAKTNSDELKKWDNRMWALVIGIVGELIGLIYMFMNNGGPDV